MSGPSDLLLANVAVVVLCHNRLDQVRMTVSERIADVHAHALELIVIDNASVDGTREWLSRIHETDPCFALVLNDQNLGVGAGRNAGWERTTRAVVITHDEDAHITTTQLRRLADVLETEPGIGVIHPIPVGTNGDPQIPVLQAPHRATNFHGACYAIRRDVMEAVGAHDERCDFGGEELDLSIRVRAKGWDVRQLPDMVVEHHALVRSGQVARWRRERWTQNHARAVWRWFPARRALSWSLLMLLGEVRAALVRRSQEELRGILSAWLRGVREGRAEHVAVPAEVVRFYAGRLGLLAAIGRLRGRGA